MFVMITNHFFARKNAYVFSPKFWFRFFGAFGVQPSIRKHPNASERIQTRPNTSKNFRKPPKTFENVAKKTKKQSENEAKTLQNGCKTV